MSTKDRVITPVRFGFLLLNQFTMISLSAAIEPLRMANRINQQEHFKWLLISATGEPVKASDQVVLNVDYGADSTELLDQIDLLIVCGGIRIRDNTDRNLLKWLRALDSKGIALGAICTGSYALAKAGVLDGYSCSIHWENVATFEESFPQVQVNRGLFTIDHDRFTCTGGIAPIDMMLHIISKQMGDGVVSAVADQFICDRVRRADDEQKIPIRHLTSNHSRKLTLAVELMEANLKEPLSQTELADYVDLSRRQLQRLFRQLLGCTPSRYYLRLRLQRARVLLRQTGLSILEVSLICGFISTSHFSKSYKEFFDYSPSQERQNRP